MYPANHLQKNSLSPNKKNIVIDPREQLKERVTMIGGNINQSALLQEISNMEPHKFNNEMLDFIYDLISQIKNSDDQYISNIQVKITEKIKYKEQQNSKSSFDLFKVQKPSEYSDLFDAIINNEDDMIKHHLKNHNNNKIDETLKNLNELLDLYQDAQQIKDNIEFAINYFAPVNKSKPIVYENNKEISKNNGLIPNINEEISDALIFASDEKVLQQLRELIKNNDDINNIIILRNAAITIIESNNIPNKIALLTEIGVRLVCSDPALISYKNTDDIDGIRNAIAALVKEPAQFNKLIYEDALYGGYISHQDILIDPSKAEINDSNLSALKYVSGNSVLKYYLTALSAQITNQPEIQIEYLQHQYLDELGNNKTIYIPKISNGIENLIMEILNSKYYPPYLVNLYKIFLTLASESTELNKIKQKRIDKGNNLENLDLYQQIDMDCNSKKNLFEIMQLILQYTKYSSKNKKVGGKGEEGSAHPEWEKKLKLLLHKFWIDGCDHTIRQQLIAKKEFQDFFSIVTNDGALFIGNENAEFYSKYVKNLWKLIKCTDLAQGYLDIALQDQNITNLLKAKAKGSNFKIEIDHNAVLSEEVEKEQRAKLISIIEACNNCEDFTDILASGSVLVELDGKFEFVNIEHALKNNNFDLLKRLVDDGLEIKTSDLNSAQIDKLSAEMIEFIYSKYFPGKSNDFNTIIEQYDKNKVPDVILYQAIKNDDKLEMLEVLEKLFSKKINDFNIIKAAINKSDELYFNKFILNSNEYISSLKENKKFQVNLIMAILDKLSLTKLDLINIISEINDSEALGKYFQDPEKKIVVDNSIISILKRSILSNFTKCNDIEELSNMVKKIIESCKAVLQDLNTRNPVLLTSQDNKDIFNKKITTLSRVINDLEEINLFEKDAIAQIKEKYAQIIDVLKLNRKTITNMLSTNKPTKSLLLFYELTKDISFDGIEIKEEIFKPYDNIVEKSQLMQDVSKNNSIEMLNFPALNRLGITDKIKLLLNNEELDGLILISFIWCFYNKLNNDCKDSVAKILPIYNNRENRIDLAAELMLFLKTTNQGLYDMLFNIINKQDTSVLKHYFADKDITAILADIVKCKAVFLESINKLST